MAKKFACVDVVDGCAWSITAKDEGELFQKIAEHAKDTITCQKFQMKSFRKSSLKSLMPS